MGNSAFNFAGANWGSPGAIGAVTPNSVRATSLAAGNVVNAAGTYTVPPEVTVIRQTSAASVYTLPDPAAFQGRFLAISTEFAGAVTSASANVVPLAGGSPAVDILPAVDGAWALLQSNGTNWIIIFQSSAGGGAALENGTWTPNVTFGGANTGITYSFRFGNWYRIGNLVILVGGFSFSNKGTSTGGMGIDGYPDQPIADGFSLSTYQSSFSFTPSGGMSTVPARIFPYKTAGSVINDTDCTNTSAFYFSIVYIKA